MNNKQFAVTVFSIIFGIICFAWAVLIGVMAKDLVKKLNILEEEKSLLEQDLIDYKWQLEQVPYICKGE